MSHVSLYVRNTIFLIATTNEYFTAKISFKLGSKNLFQLFINMSYVSLHVREKYIFFNCNDKVRKVNVNFVLAIKKIMCFLHAN
jgi:hypothetical protein